MPTYRRESASRPFALLFTFVCALVAGLVIALGAMLSTAQAAPIGMLKQYKVPTAGSSPEHITQASDGILYFTKNDAPLGRITTDGEMLPDAGERFSFNGNGLDAHSDDIWVTDFNHDSVWRYHIPTGTFTQFPTPAS